MDVGCRIEKHCTFYRGFFFLFLPFSRAVRYRSLGDNARTFLVTALHAGFLGRFFSAAFTQPAEFDYLPLSPSVNRYTQHNPSSYPPPLIVIIIFFIHNPHE